MAFANEADDCDPRRSRLSRIKTMYGGKHTVWGDVVFLLRARESVRMRRAALSKRLPGRRSCGAMPDLCALWPP
jgi:hypothetical protein